MKVIIVGDAVVSTGFSRCSHALADELHSRGHEVAVLGINYWGDPHRYPYAIFPCFNPVDECRSRFGTDRLPKLIHRYSPDAVVLLNDPWNIAAYFSDLDAILEEGYELPKMIGWLAVDAENQQSGALNRLDHIVTWTRFGEKALQDAGVGTPITIVPLGVNPKIFSGRKDRVQSRKICLPAQDAEREDLFVVGVVGRNQHRKRLDVTISVFAKAWKRAGRPENWRLYLHVAPTGEDGYDLKSIADFYGVRTQVLLSKPEKGRGIDESLLPYLYSSFDVYLSTSQCEGWGLPAQEAMSCRVPCVLPDFGSFGPAGWVLRGAAYLAPVTHRLASAPFGGQMHTLGGLLDEDRAAACLHRLYSHGGAPSDLLDSAEATAKRLTLDLTGQLMADVVESAVR